MTAASAVPGLEGGVTLAGAQRMMADTFRSFGVDSPETDARALLCAALNLTRAQLVSESDRILEAPEAAVASALASRRTKREPVARILGRKEFWSLQLTVTPDVLIPRPETETLVEAALDWVQTHGLRGESLRILDIGTGSGALVLALLQELPEARGVAVDISPAAIAVARNNAERHNLAGRCEFVVCNIADALGARFDLIVSNPPYIAHAAIEDLDPEVRAFDPRLALDGGADGLDAYRLIAATVPILLRPGGRLIVELGIGQEGPVRSLMEANTLDVAVRPDLAGISRALITRLGAGSGTSPV